MKSSKSDGILENLIPALYFTNFLQQAIYIYVIEMINMYDIMIKTDSMRGPGGHDTCHLSDLDETWPD